ncbi:7820_t:CDS:2 [Ambispora leptoticha]|uniref:7820_t:CDS:1 n=1 Tax=Ambispora leptoticha TaxID=144679 RepID=A0A9N9GFW7_9GLOM|nr:7820_t:CDS:2 [Ambispora leptoticha]
MSSGRKVKPSYDSIPESERILARSASAFGQDDLEALKVSFHPASEYDIIPDIKVTIPEQYILPNINHDLLTSRNFNVENFTEISDGHVKTFVDKLHDVVKNSGVDAGTNESTTDTLVNDLLLHVTDFDNWPFKVRLQPPLQLITKCESVTAEPEFVINTNKIVLIGVEDKHLKSRKLYERSLFGEAQIAGEILAGASDNEAIESYSTDQEMFAIRVISTYVTFYRTTISPLYWEELVRDRGLPKEQSVVIKRWPGENGRTTGLNLAEPDGRKAVITDLIKIRQHLLGEK